MIRDEDGNYLIHKRPSKGLLANLWEFPNIEVDLSIAPDHQQLQAFIQNEYGADIKINAPFTTIQHVFSHIVWNVTVYEAELVSDISALKNLKVVSEKDLEQYAFPVSHQKILKEYLLVK